MNSTVQPDTALIARLLYGVSLAVSAGFVSFLLLLLIGRQMGLGEPWVALGLAWWFSLPILGLSAAVGTVTFRRYQLQASWAGTFRVYVLTVMGVVIAWMVTGAAVGSLIAETANSPLNLTVVPAA